MTEIGMESCPIHSAPKTPINHLLKQYSLIPKYAMVTNTKSVNEMDSHTILECDKWKPVAGWNGNHTCALQYINESLLVLCCIATGSDDIGAFECQGVKKCYQIAHQILKPVLGLWD